MAGHASEVHIPRDEAWRVGSRHSGGCGTLTMAEGVSDYLLAHSPQPDEVQRELIEVTTALGGVSSMRILRTRVPS